MVNLPDETLMAYADGALSESERHSVEAILAADPVQQRRLEPFVLTRNALPSIFSEALTSAVPDRLIATVMTAPIGTRSALPKQKAKAEPFFSRLRVALFPELPAFAGAMAFAASLAVIAGAGYVAGHLTHGSSADGVQATAALDDDAIAAGPLKLALDRTVSNSVFEQGLVRVTPVLTFRDHDGRYCRQYTMARSGAQEVAGYACRRSDGRWSIAFHAPSSLRAADQTAAQSSAGSQGFTPAGGHEEGALEKAIDKTISGDVLDRKDEDRLIAEGWPRQTAPPQGQP